MVEQTAPADFLDLRLAPREVVRIDGKTYDLTPLGDLSVTAQAMVRRHAERVAAIEKKGERATPDDDREYEDRLRQLTAIAIPKAPAAIIKKLGLGQVRAVVTTFFVRGAAAPALVQMVRRARRSPTLSRTSRASTARATGSSTRR